MRLNRTTSLLVPAALVSATLLSWAGLDLQRYLTAILAAAVFAGLAIGIAVRQNAPLWSLPASRTSAQAVAIAGMRNAVLMALAYGWGALCLMGTYGLAGLKWQHGLQYAAGMALFGLLSALIGRSLGSEGSRLRTPTGRQASLALTIAQGCAAVAGLVFLIGSGKLAGAKPDWPANVVFLFGGIAIAVLSALAAWTHVRLTHAASAADQRTRARLT